VAGGPEMEETGVRAPDPAGACSAWRRSDVARLIRRYPLFSGEQQLRRRRDPLQASSNSTPLRADTWLLRRCAALVAHNRFDRRCAARTAIALATDARVRSRAPLARSDLRFARAVRATGTCEINGSRSSAVRVSSERHRRRLGRSLLARPISALTARTRCPRPVVHMQEARVHHR
jgi:hypothetical protein